MENGAEIEAIDLLHDCVANDAVGIVATRIWGNQHRYHALWPEQLEVEFDLGIPAEVASYLGFNNLPEGEKVSVENTNHAADAPEYFSGDVAHNPRRSKTNERTSDRVSIFENVQSDNETIKMVDEIFEKMSKKLKQPDLKRTDGRYPVYVILSLKNRFNRKIRQTNIPCIGYGISSVVFHG